MFKYTPNGKSVKMIYHTVAENALIKEIAYDFYENSSPDIFTRELHPFYEILLIVKGDVTCDIAGVKYPVSPYDLILIPPSTYHFLNSVPITPCEHYIIQFLPNDSDAKRVSGLFSPPYILNISDDANLIKMFSFFDSFYDSYSSEDLEQAAQANLKQILISLCYKEKEKAYSKKHQSFDMIQEIILFIDENLERKLDSEIIAKRMQFSKSYIQNSFLKTMRMGIKKYINQKKIHAAHSDIQNGMSPILAASKYSFSDYSTFYRQYKKVFRCSPNNGKQ